MHRVMRATLGTAAWSCRWVYIPVAAAPTVARLTRASALKQSEDTALRRDYAIEARTENSGSVM